MDFEREFLFNVMGIYTYIHIYLIYTGSLFPFCSGAIFIYLFRFFPSVCLCCNNNMSCIIAYIGTILFSSMVISTSYPRSSQGSAAHRLLLSSSRQTATQPSTGTGPAPRSWHTRSLLSSKKFLTSTPVFYTTWAG